MPVTTPESTYIKSANEMMKYIGIHFTSNACIFTRNATELNNKQYIFNTLSRLLNIQDPCCAVFPEYDSKHKQLNRIFVSHNVNVVNESQRVQYDVICTLICQITRAEKVSDIFELMKYLATIKHYYYKFGQYYKSYLRRYQLFRETHDELNQILPDYSIDFRDSDSTDEFVSKYHGLINFIIQMDKLVDKYYIEDFYSNGAIHEIYMIVRIYLDCINVANYFRVPLIKSQFVLIPNSDNSHAEINLLNYIFKNNIKLTRNVSLIGISKLSCVLCYDVFYKHRLEYLLPGSHGLLYVSNWKLPMFFSDPKWVQFLTLEIFPKIFEICGKTDFKLFTSRFRNETDIRMIRFPYQRDSDSISSDTEEISSQDITDLETINQLSSATRYIFRNVFEYIDYDSSWIPDAVKDSSKYGISPYIKKR